MRNQYLCTQQINADCSRGINCVQTVYTKRAMVNVYCNCKHSSLQIEYSATDIPCHTNNLLSIFANKNFLQK